MSLKDQVGEVSQERIEQEYAKSQNNSSGFDGSVDLYNFRKGITQIRVLPPLKGKDHWKKEIFEHYIPVGGKKPRVTCLSMFNEDCPVCDEGKRLHNTNDPDNLDRAKDLQPKRKYIANALVLSSPDGSTNATSGVQVIKFGAKVEEPLSQLDWDFQGGWGNMTDIEKGFDVRINRTGETMNTTVYTVQGVPNKTSVAEACAAQGVNPDSLQLYDLDTCLDHPSRNKLISMLKDDYVPGFPSSPEPVEVPTSLPPQQSPPHPDVVPVGSSGDSSPDSVPVTTTGADINVTTNNPVEVPDVYSTQPK